MMAEETAKRPLRICETCGGVDDHPRHVFAHAPGDAVTPDDVSLKAMENAQALKNVTPEELLAITRQIADDATVMKHMDCCRHDGCPDGTCDQVTKGAEDLRGDKLVAHLTKGN